jgi:hypothetical protein
LAADLKEMIGEFKVAQSDRAAHSKSTDSANLIVWDSSFQFGIDVIDKQHQMIVDILNTTEAGNEMTAENNSRI